MAERDEIKDTSGKTAASPDATPAKSDLPKVESPPLSPASEPTAEPVAAEPTIDIAAIAKPPSRTRIGVRYRRNAMLAASVTIAAAFGAIIGALATGGFNTPTHVDVAGVEETKAMRQSLSQLGKEITTLKANIEASNKAAHSQIAKISERFDRGQQDITGSIAAAVPAAPAVTPVPAPRPAPRIASVEAQPPLRPPVVLSWTIRNARDGVIYVENHGEVYQVSLGAPLPGLGPVEAVRRQDGRWMVVTPKGIIVAMRDRRYFEAY